MGRKRVELSEIHPYHICARSNNRTWFELPLSQVFEIYANHMEKTILKYQIECHAFVLMANHFHMLISTPTSNLSQAMRYFMTETSREIARACSRINRIYGRRYHWTIIRTAEHYAHAYSYVYRNPIHHNAVQGLEQYSCSSLTEKNKNFSRLIVDKKQGYDAYIPHCRRELISWLESNKDQEYDAAISRCLKHHEFLFPQDRITGKRNTYFDKLHPQKTPGT